MIGIPARRLPAPRRQPGLAGLARFALMLGAAALPPAPSAAQEGVAETVHNLSVSGPGTIKAVNETEVCKFCHVPHNAEAAAPLWGHAVSRADYAVPEISTEGGARRPAPQPDGSSRLCLSCHDGTVALGDIIGVQAPVAMSGADRLLPGRRGFLGTDLSGSHPISFVVPDGAVEGSQEAVDMALKPLVAIHADGEVRLDAEGKMQCTTCHDPHADRYYEPGRTPRFWVKPTVEAVCLTCHALR